MARSLTCGGLIVFFRVVNRFREQLSVDIHVSAGQPSYGPELISIRHRNSTVQADFADQAVERDDGFTTSTNWENNGKRVGFLLNS